MGENGRLIRLPDQIAYVNIGRSDKAAVLDPAALLTYPNPSEDFINVHLNGKNQLLSMRLYNTDGTMVSEIKNSDQKHQLIDVQNLTNGLYLLKVETSLGPISKKLEVFR